jgi:NAD(P)-dependent dehydrogenase (short-subunit alcohol dehydrogenase family)
MTTTLITRSNKGLVYETARQLLAAGHTGYIGARDPERGREAAAKAIEADGRLDFPVNNADIEGHTVKICTAVNQSTLVITRVRLAGLGDETGARLRRCRVTAVAKLAQSGRN